MWEGSLQETQGKSTTLQIGNIKKPVSNFLTNGITDELWMSNFPVSVKVTDRNYQPLVTH